MEGWSRAPGGGEARRREARHRQWSARTVQDRRRPAAIHTDTDIEIGIAATPPPPAGASAHSARRPCQA